VNGRPHTQRVERYGTHQVMATAGPLGARRHSQGRKSQRWISVCERHCRFRRSAAGSM